MEHVSGCFVSQMRRKRHIYYLQLFDYWKAVWKLTEGIYFHVPQALDKMEAQHNMSQCVTMETEEIIMPTCDTETCTDGKEDKQALQKKDEVKSEAELNQFPTMHNDAASSDIRCEDGVGTADEAVFCQQMDDSGAKEPPGDDGCLSAEDCEASSPERMLQESVDRLKTLMETDVWRERRTSGPRTLFPTLLITDS